jgi:hypothetical protein
MYIGSRRKHPSRRQACCGTARRLRSSRAHWVLDRFLHITRAIDNGRPSVGQDDLWILMKRNPQRGVVAATVVRRLPEQSTRGFLYYEVLIGRGA